MPEFSMHQRCGEDLERYLRLKTLPVAVKMLESENEIPEGALRPKKERGCHLAQCQALALSRREGLTVAMLKEDNWCWGPLIAYGLVDPAIADKFSATKEQARTMPCFERGKYVGILTAPLNAAGFKPDVVLVYSNTSQLRSLLMAVKYLEKSLVSSVFDPIDSCVYSIVPVILSGEYRITLPDPGEYQRALAGEDEIIFSIPGKKLEGLVSALAEFEKMKHGYTHSHQQMMPDFPQPEFYQQFFKDCGLDSPIQH